jgi:YHS domain-containing protein
VWNPKVAGIEKEKTMKSLTRTLVAVLLLSTPLFAGDLVNVSGASKVAIDGFDPVAFFTDSRPVNGDPHISTTYEGATYYFATEEHRKLFAQNPGQYAPQYGGFCAYGAALSALFPVDISTWQIRNGKLYLNLNPEILKAFNADFNGNIAKAEKNWPGLVAKNGK